jgi:amidase
MTGSAVEQAERVRSGEVSARELVEASLAAIERANPRINALVTLAAERALAEADAIEPGDPRPLCGVPVAIKDLGVLTEGLLTTHGSDALGDWVPAVDSEPVRRLRAAGAIVVGKTNTPEFGLRPVTEPARFGPTRNPWNPDLVPGGSSGGSAAAVASGMVALAHGNDMGGSIRIPASCCGVVGLKPSRGRVSTAPVDWGGGAVVVCEGLLSTTVLDAAAGLDVLAGPLAGDLFAAPPPERPFAESARADPAPLRIHLAMDAPNRVPVEPDCIAAARAAADALEDLGHAVEEAAPEWDDDGFEQRWMTVGLASVQQLVGAFGRLRGAPLDTTKLEPMTRFMAESPPIGAADLGAATEWLGALARRIVAAWPADRVLVTPAMTTLPGPVGGVEPGEGIRYSAFVRLFNITGQPALSLPLRETADGVPVGVQLVGPPNREGLLFSVAAQLEARLGRRPVG